jgi:hypothetical protein
MEMGKNRNVHQEENKKDALSVAHVHPNTFRERKREKSGKPQA